MTVVAERVPTTLVGSHALRTEIRSPFLRGRHLQRHPDGARPGRGLVEVGQKLTASADAIGAWLGLRQRPAMLDQELDQVPFVRDNLEQLEWLYDRLADDHSRQVLVELLRARALGRAYLAPPAQAARYRQRQQSIQRDLNAEQFGARPSLPDLHYYHVRGPNGSIRLQDRAEHGVLHTFLLEQYAYLHEGTTIRAEPGDVVVDGGGRLGDAALYFADLVGHDGRVYSLEQSAGRAAIIAQNLTLNPRLLGRVSIVEAVLAERSGERVSYEAHGPVTSLVRVDQWGRLMVDATTITIDDVVEREEIRRVDLLRLDVGGTELEALAGARQTIVNHLPTLVVALYHAQDDIITIPALLDTLAPDFDVFLDDITPNGTGTVLFARPRPGTRGRRNGEQTVEAIERSRTISPDAARGRGQAR